MCSKLIKPIEQLTLKRYPEKHDPSLQAWNAADCYILEELQQHSISPNSKILIVNDQFGALSSALSGYSINYWTDSYLSQCAILKNIKHNMAGAKVTVGVGNEVSSHINSINLSNPTIKPTDSYDCLVLRLPKHNSLLAWQLEIIKSVITEQTLIIAAGMSKEIHNSQIVIFEKIIGKTRTSLAKRKARLILPKLDPNKIAKTRQELHKNSLKNYTYEPLDITAYGYPGVFSRHKLDQGARVLLQFLPHLTAGQSVLDLGCGNGILGTAVAAQNSGIRVTFSDESWLAIQSAKKTYTDNITQQRSELQSTAQQAQYYVTDALEGINENNFDLVLCNPPFHQQNSQTLSIAKKMFADSAKKLQPQGELRVVANRHLHYGKLLRNYFTKVNVISKDPKFIVWQATNPKRQTKIYSKH